MTKHSHNNESYVRVVRSGSKSKFTTIPKVIVNTMNIQDTDILMWGIHGAVITITVIAGEPKTTPPDAGVVK